MFKNSKDMYDTTLQDVADELRETINDLIKARDTATGFEYVGLDSLVKRLHQQSFIFEVIPRYIKNKPLKDYVS